MSWVDCVVDNDYQIFTEEPHQIRRKSNKRIVKESIHKTTGYIRCYLNQKFWNKHRIIALQFIPNPNNQREIDHINRIRTDNRIENLRWVSPSDNQKNKSSCNNYQYNYVDKLSDNSFEITTYGNHQFEDLYYDVETDKFYYYTGIEFRELLRLSEPGRRCFVWVCDINHKQVRIAINTFKRLYNI